MPVAAAQRNAFALAAVGAFIDRVAERAGPANSHALENAFFARRQMRVRRQKAGEESAQDGADVLPGLAAIQAAKAAAKGKETFMFVLSVEHVEHQFIIL